MTEPNTEIVRLQNRIASLERVLRAIASALKVNAPTRARETRILIAAVLGVEYKAY
jgi:hypothetical protein